MDLKAELITDVGQAVGFGRVKLPKITDAEFNLDVPLFSFVVIEREDDRLKYIASCVDLPIDGYGNTVKEAALDMSANVYLFFYENYKNAVCKESFWENLYLLSKTNPNSSVLLDQYHALQYLCAKQTGAFAEELKDNLAKTKSTMPPISAVRIPEAISGAMVEYDTLEMKGELEFA
jgi:hypothetical protein